MLISWAQIFLDLTVCLANSLLRCKLINCTVIAVTNTSLSVAIGLPLSHPKLPEKKKKIHSILRVKRQQNSIIFIHAYKRTPSSYFIPDRSPGKPCILQSSKNTRSSLFLVAFIVQTLLHLIKATRHEYVYRAP